MKKPFINRRNFLQQSLACLPWSPAVRPWRVGTAECSGKE